MFKEIATESVRVKGLQEILRDADQWGTPVRFNSHGQPTIFVMVIAPEHDDEPLGAEITHVLWAPEPIEVDGPSEREREPIN